MLWSAVAGVLSLLVELVMRRVPDSEQALEIALLRYQLRALERSLGHQPRLNRWDKCMVAVLFQQLKHRTQKPIARLKLSLLFTPQTILTWHRELVQGKWAFQQKRRAGRPRSPDEVRRLVLRLANENSTWGYGKIVGELLKLGYDIDRATVRNILKSAGIVPAPERQRNLNWQTFLSHYRHQTLACDFFTVETLGLKTLYVLFFIELGSRQVHLVGCTEHPTSAWVTQQGRQMVWTMNEAKSPVRFLLHDNDTKFTGGFDLVFAVEGVEVIHTPPHAPNANAVAERFVRSVRQECLEQLIILSDKHLWRVLKSYEQYYNTRRPHQGLAQQCPISLPEASVTGMIQRHDLLGGILHDYQRAA